MGRLGPRALGDLETLSPSFWGLLRLDTSLLGDL